jgi:hypothetical protein
MATILTTEDFDPNSPASRVARLETLLNHKEFQWYLGQLRKKEADGVAACCNVMATAEARNQSCHHLAGLRLAINFAQSEHDVAVNQLKEEIHKESPDTPKPKPVL